jgi:hypothetical protein
VHAMNARTFLSWRATQLKSEQVMGGPGGMTCWLGEVSAAHWLIAFGWLLVVSVADTVCTHPQIRNRIHVNVSSSKSGETL